MSETLRVGHRPVSDRITRGCDVCAGVDDHPRHVTSVREGGVPDQDMIDKLLANNIPAAAMAEILDPTTVVRHFDCCNCEVCQESLANAPEGAKHGTKLIAHLTKGM